MSLSEYEGKRIRVIFRDGQMLEGECAYYESALDNPDGNENITLITKGIREKELYIQLTSDEVQQIENID